MKSLFKKLLAASLSGLLFSTSAYAAEPLKIGYSDWPGWAVRADARKHARGDPATMGDTRNPSNHTQPQGEPQNYTCVSTATPDASFVYRNRISRFAFATSPQKLQRSGVPSHVLRKPPGGHSLSVLGNPPLRIREWCM